MANGSSSRRSCSSVTSSRRTHAVAWMDGWETRRRRDGGDYDWCIVRHGVRAVVRGFDVETTFFKGNYPESCAIDVCDASALATVDALSRAAWREIVRRTTLAGDSHN